MQTDGRTDLIAAAQGGAVVPQTALTRRQVETTVTTARGQLAH